MEISGGRFTGRAVRLVLPKLLRGQRSAGCPAFYGGVNLNNLISVSILNADILHLEDEIRKLENAGVDMLHFDVMDGVFVNNISFGIPVLKAVSETTELFLDVHLMITDPLKYVEDFVKAGADMITFHYESVSDPFATVDAIHRAGCKAGISIKPDTPAEAVIPFLDKVDAVLIMTVEPGFGGQGYISEMTEKIAAVRKAVSAWDREILLEVDGGINDLTGAEASRAGADILAVGSYLVKHPDTKAAVELLRTCGQENPSVKAEPCVR
jgi:ribulose-phosphate 3-epimerase